MRTFASLQHRNYRLLWIGSLISQSGDWMDQIAFNWLVLEMTGSPIYIGLVNLCRAVPIVLFTTIGGVAADRFERRKLMMLTQAFAMLLAFLLAFLVSSGTVQIWQILVIAVLRGTMMSLNLPVRQTIISDLVPQRSLANAIALNSVTFNLTRIIGPALGGIIISLIGVAGCFYVNALSFLAVIWTLYIMELPLFVKRDIQANIRQSITDGFKYIRSRPTIMLLIIVATVPNFFGQPYMQMLTVFAHDVLSIGAAGLGVLTSATAIGAVVGGLGLASLRHSSPRGTIMLIGMIAFGALLLLFSFSPWPIVSVFLLFGVGAMNTSYNATNNTLLQISVPDEYRGRVISTLFLNRGLTPLGATIVGTMAVFFGMPLAMGSMAIVIVVLGIFILATAPSLRELS